MGEVVTDVARLSKGKQAKIASTADSRSRRSLCIEHFSGSFAGTQSLSSLRIFTFYLQKAAKQINLQKMVQTVHYVIADLGRRVQRTSIYRQTAKNHFFLLFPTPSVYCVSRSTDLLFDVFLCALSLSRLCAWVSEHIYICY